MKKINFLFFLLSFFLLENTIAQEISMCGTLPPHFASSTDSDYIFADRFGNTYSEEDLAIGNSFAGATITAGYFEIECVGLPADFEPVIQSVFEEISSIVLQKPNDCGTASETVNIQIIATPNLGDGKLGSASAIYQYLPYFETNNSSCREIMHDRVYRKINGGIVPGAGSTQNVDGIMRLNTSETWHTSLSVPDPTSNAYDLRTVVFHEAIHILGFSSVINKYLEYRDYYTIWDKNLYLADSYSSTGGSSSSSSLITSDCTHNCWNINPNTVANYTDLEDIVLNSCDVPGEPLVVFGASGIAPIWGGEGIIPADFDDYNNALSHLSPSCGGEDFLMQSILGTGERNELSAKEIEILCELGYTTSACTGCSIVTQVDNAFPDSDEECCVKEFYACNSETMVIPFSDLFCNDQISSSAVITSVETGHDNILVELIDGEIHLTNQLNQARANAPKR